MPITQPHAAGLHQREWNGTSHQCKYRKHLLFTLLRFEVYSCKSLPLQNSQISKASELNLLSRLNRSSWRCPCWTYEKGEKCLQTFTWTLTMRKYVRCSVAPVAEQEVQGLVFWRMACAPLLRGSPETVTSAWTWITGYVFPNRYNRYNIAIFCAVIMYNREVRAQHDSNKCLQCSPCRPSSLWPTPTQT